MGRQSYRVKGTFCDQKLKIWPLKFQTNMLLRWNITIKFRLFCNIRYFSQILFTFLVYQKSHVSLVIYPSFKFNGNGR